MAYKVLKRFVDEDGKVYDPKDKEVYSNKLSKERERVLTTSNNKYGYPFLEKIQVEDLGDKTVAELKEIADEKGVEYDSNIRKDDLKELLR